MLVWCYCFIWFFHLLPPLIVVCKLIPISHFFSQLARHLRKAATAVQCNWRCFQASREVAQRRWEKKQNDSAMAMQNQWRSHQARWELDQRRQVQREMRSALSMQCGWRSHGARRELERRRKIRLDNVSATAVQGGWRCKRARAEASRRRKAREELRLKRLATLMFNAKARAATRIQRGRRRQITNRCRHRAALVVQRAVPLRLGIRRRRNQFWTEVRREKIEKRGKPGEREREREREKEREKPGKKRERQTEIHYS